MLERDSMRCFQVLLIGMFICDAAFAQSVYIGITGGARLTDDLHSSGSTVSESKRYTVGPAIEVDLWKGFGLELDALYKRVGTSEVYYGIINDRIWSRDRSNSLEFPVLAKYRFSRKLPGPYLAGGYAFRHIGGSGTSTRISPYENPPVSQFSYPTHYENSSGMVMAGGLEFHLSHLRISPEFRYTRWLTGGLTDNGPRGFYVLSAQNQAEILVGIAWLAGERRK